MKRLILTITAIAAVAGPMAITATEASAQDRGRHYDRRDDRRDDRRYDRRESRRDSRQDYRRDQRWDSRTRWNGGQHNGYYYNNQWHYGPPPTTYYGRPGYAPGHAAWRRGAYLPSYYRSRGYVVSDYGRYRLRPPPRGYYWYRDGNDFLLAAVATGLILDVIINH
ncbi:MAG: RcnB family protein [Caulobacter sp.]|nr:RcnB family protein [Caulobacter sp.]